MLLTHGPSCNQCTIAVVMTTYDTDILFSSNFTTVVPRGGSAYFRESLLFDISISLFDELLTLNFEEFEIPRLREKAIEKGSVETLVNVGTCNLFDFLRDSE